MSNPIENRESGGISPNEEKKVGGMVSLQGKVGEPAEFQCKVCGQVFTNQADLSEHMLSHERTQESAVGVG